MVTQGWSCSQMTWGRRWHTPRRGWQFTVLTYRDYNHLIAYVFTPTGNLPACFWTVGGSWNTQRWGARANCHTAVLHYSEGLTVNAELVLRAIIHQNCMYKTRHGLFLDVFTIGSVSNIMEEESGCEQSPLSPADVGKLLASLYSRNPNCGCSWYYWLNS